jgi:iron-sulfur cluster insertion protein
MIVFTDAAISRIAKILDQEENKNLHLRVFVQGGGCSGMEYGFTLDEERAQDDFELTVGDRNAVIDAASMQYLQGATIDYKESLTESRFVINNPNATAQCGCGSSFAV